MSRSYTLSDNHYASNWSVPEDDGFNIRESVNDLALYYAKLPDGADKESAFLQLVECFHGYLMKYMNMVVRGQMPNMKSSVGKDAAEMLKKLLPRGIPIDFALMSRTCKSLHLAFKGQTADEIYDTMVLCFLGACRRYDPHYTDKVRQVYEALNANKVSNQFTAEAIAAVVGFNALGCIRMLVRKQYLVTIVGTKRKIIGYERGPEWPPEPSFFESGPIGFTYFVCMWFRYYLAETIVAAQTARQIYAEILQHLKGHAGLPAAIAV